MASAPGTEDVAREAVRRAVVATSAMVLVGAIASGPLGIALVGITRPQPAWRDVSTFVAAYHPIQVAPYALGVVLVGGCLGMVTTLSALAAPRLRARAVLAVPVGGAFAAMILFNYVLQTTFVPALVRGAPEGREPIAALTMANPRSLGWALEMWGYALLGIATWLVAPVFSGSRLERTTSRLFALNGPVSLAGGVWTTLAPGWVATPPGLAAFALWNVLIVAMAAGALVCTRRRGSAP